jgi:hypothetical protein
MSAQTHKPGLVPGGLDRVARETFWERPRADVGAHYFLAPSYSPGSRLYFDEGRGAARLPGVWARFGSRRPAGVPCLVRARLPGLALPPSARFALSAHASVMRLSPSSHLLPLRGATVRL